MDYSSILKHILPTVDHSTSPTWDTAPWQANTFESLLQDLWPDVANVQPPASSEPSWNPVAARTPPVDPVWNPDLDRGPPPEDKPINPIEATLLVIINATMPVSHTRLRGLTLGTKLEFVVLDKRIGLLLATRCANFSLHPSRNL